MSEAPIQAAGTAGLKDRVLELYSAFGRGDIPFILGLLSEDIEWCFYGPDEFGFTGLHRGHSEVQQFFEQVATSHTVKVFEPRELYADGQTVIVVGYEEASRPTGHGLILSEWVHVITFSEGLITRLRGFVDTAAFARVLLPR